MKIRLYALLVGAIFYNQVAMAAATLIPPATILATSFEDIPKLYIGKNGSLAFYHNTAASNPVNFPTAGAYKITINAFGTAAAGVFPKMNVYMDDALISSITVDSKTAKDYSITHNAAAGFGTLRLAFTNDYYSRTEDRNLFVKSVGITPAAVIHALPSTMEAANLRIRTAGTLANDGSWQLNQSGYVGDDYLITAGKTTDFVIDAYGNPSGGVNPELRVYADSYLLKTISVGDYVPTKYRFSYTFKEGGTRRLRFALGNPSSDKVRQLNLQTIALTTDSGTGGGPGDTSAQVSYDFTAGDTLAPKGGWSFDSSNWPITAVAGSYFKGLEFTYGGAAPGIYTTSELRFKTPHNDQFWVQFRLHVPSNYAHRFDTKLDITGDSLQGWQVGDQIRAADGVTVGVISGVVLTQTDGVTPGIFLRNPPSFWDNGVWVGSVHNLTRSKSATSTARAFWSNNNKLFAMWADGYSAKGLGPTIAWEMWASDTPSNQTSKQTDVTVHYSRGDYVGANSHVGASNGPFIALSDAGKYIDVVVHGKFTSAKGAKDGVIETWVRKESATGFTRVHHITDADMDKRSDIEPALQQWQHGYLMGWSNSSFDQDTTFHISKLKYAKERPAELPSN